jgi:dihydroorotate dehydrogenase (NAD+) catalytic subunit
MLARLERVEGAAGVEIGLPPEVDQAAVRAFAMAAAGELPVVLRLPFERAAELAGRLAGVLAESGTAAISLAPPRGALRGPSGGLVHGRLYGPAVFPLALAAVRALAQAGVPVIGSGGVYSPEDYEAMLGAGAIAVQLDAVLWRGGFFDKSEGLIEP